MKKIFVRLSILLALLVVSAASCSTYKKINYIQDAQLDTALTMIANQGILIQPMDMISIVVSSRDPELARIYNLPVVTYQAGSESSVSNFNQRLIGYSVDNDGNIQFPELGTIHVAGLNRWQLAELIREKLSSLVKDAVVTVQFMNFKISVTGEVTSPGVFDISGDKITIFEAISLARNLTIYGRRDGVYVIREQNGSRIIYQVDLRTVDMFNSPAYYLQQNDVVYVEPNKVRAGQSTINENNLKSVSLWVSIGSFLTTLATLFISLFAGRASAN
ncbi:MAG: polysaccharide biosynthesis/export family protein [Bacteroidales bacterium]|nr:polysaccharide biosynthesis/export family protein [Bacteroidales bacterium]MDD6509499.1 polysaccharide biosynthesis/export family protein [Bacteroidales bacterium]